MSKNKPAYTNQPPIQISKWGHSDGNGNIHVDSGPRPLKMCNSDGTALSLLKDGCFGADIIRFGANEGVTNHTHPGSHMLFTVKGTGFVEYNGVDYALEPGVCYLIPSMVDHAIKASSELILLAIGNDHRDADSEDRMDLV